jgi:hypothetical protein
VPAVQDEELDEEHRNEWLPFSLFELLDLLD